jgi:WD40 repeat protein
VVTTLQSHSSGIKSVAFSPDGKYLASGSFDSTIKLWSMENFQEIYDP